MSCGDEYPDNEEEEKEVAVVCPEWGGVNPVITGIVRPVMGMAGFMKK